MVCSPSVVMTMASDLAPRALKICSMALTLPDTLEWIGAETAASLSPMSWPTLTVSPTFTTGLQGSSIFCYLEMVTAAGTGMITLSNSAVFFWCFTWMLGSEWNIATGIPPNCLF